MKSVSLALFLLLAAAPALAGTAANQSPVTGPAQAAAGYGKAYCWYNDDGNFTGKQPAPADEAVHHRQVTGRGGSHAWVYTIDRSDGDHCPQQLPGGST